MDYIDLGRRVRRQRNLLNLTQAELAEKIGVSTSFVGHMERGSRKASLDTMVDLANALGLGLDYLLASSLNTESATDLTPAQRDVMRDILATVQSRVKDWNKTPEATEE